MVTKSNKTGGISKRDQGNNSHLQQPNTNDQLQNQIISILVANQYVAENKVNDLILAINKSKKNIIQYLRESGSINPEDLAKTLSEFYHLPFIKLKDLNLNIEVISRLPKDISKNYFLVAFDVVGDKLYKIATSRPEDPNISQVISFLKTKNNIDTELYIASEPDLLETLKIFEIPQRSLKSLVKNPIKKDESNLTIFKPVTAEKPAQSLPIDQNQPAANVDSGIIDIAALVHQDIKDSKDLETIVAGGMAPTIVAALIKYAVELKASDIHIEPEEKVLKIRFRIDGVLRNIIDLNLNIHPAIVARIKISAHLKIDEQRIPQDGRFDANYDNKKIDIRVSTLPTSHGEKVVMRLLDKTKGVISIEELGLTGKGYQILVKNIKKPYGMILSTGPTGSGKTTTLYAILQTINNPQINIVTLEDPIEYQLEGVNHVQVRPDIGFDFANGLRSIVRQDPNVIMVGEIRDKETAEMAIHAALTGHLLLSTLHTNDAAGAIPRLIDMGIEPFLISSTLNVIIAQRLVRKICQKCRVKAQIPQDLLIRIKKEVDTLPVEIRQKLPRELVFYQGRGCPECTNGYSGRIGVFEVLDINESIQQLIVSKATSEEISELAIKNGMITIRQDGLIKALTGVTTLDEVLRISLSQ